MGQAAPAPFGIEGLNTEVYADFRAGRVTEENLTEMKLEQLLLANNVVILADKMCTKRPGYTLVQTVVGKVLSLFDFQRDYDQKQFLLVNSAGRLSLADVHGTGSVTVLSTVEDQVQSHQYIPGNFACYLSNGVKSYTLLDNAGTPKLYTRGISAPVSAPSVALVAGTLTTTYGQQYAYCYVRKVTDSTGVTRLHIGPPSPLSTSTGPMTSNMANVSAFAAPPDATWNFIWIFRTNDTPANSTSALFFLAEIAVGTVTYGDALADTSLDLTRPIPYDNFPPIAGGILLDYQSRIITCQGNTVQASGLEEILLGIPQETAPASLFFIIPGGKSFMSGAAKFNETAYLCTKDFWWQITGYDVSTFKKRDKVVQPGAVGKKAIALTPTHLVYLGRDRKLYAWDGVSSRPIEVSKNLAKQLAGTVSMQDISAADIENAEVRWFSWNRYRYVMVLVNTGSVPAGQFDWIQLWNTTFLDETLADGSTVMLSETDFWPTDAMSASAPVEVDLATYMFFGDPNGKIYRWPDGGLDNGKNFSAAAGGPWSGLRVYIGPMFHPLPPTEVIKRGLFQDVHTDRIDAATGGFKLDVILTDTPDMAKKLINVPLGPLNSSNGSGPELKAARANLSLQPGTSIGRWYRWIVVFPDDAQPATLVRTSVSARPLFGVAP
jgi:hypothetical protein